MIKELQDIQQSLKAPKDKNNSFGGYKYRSCESILEAVKPILKSKNCTLTLSDDIIACGNYVFVKATATITNANGESISTSAFARHDENKKGMDASQITGSASSYARKYALNGLFCIDDTKDADTDEFHNTQRNYEKAQQRQQSSQQPISTTSQSSNDWRAKISACNTREELVTIYNTNRELQQDPDFVSALNNRMSQINTQAA